MQYSPRITPTNTAFVHHIIVYLCGALVNVTEGQSSPCVGAAGVSLDECRLGVVLGGWAIGGEVSINTNGYTIIILCMCTYDYILCPDCS